MILLLDRKSKNVLIIKICVPNKKYIFSLKTSYERSVLGIKCFINYYYFQEGRNATPTKKKVIFTKMPIN